MQAIISLRRNRSRSSLSRHSSQCNNHRKHSKLTRPIDLGNGEPFQALLATKSIKKMDNTPEKSNEQKLDKQITLKKNRHSSDEMRFTNKKRKIFKLCVSHFKSFFSNVGLVLLVFFYSTLGALMFQLLEQHEEIKICEEGAARFQRELKHYRETIKLFILYNNTEMSFDMFSITPSVAIESNSTTISTSNLNETTPTYKQRHQESLDELLIEFRKKVIDIEKMYKFSGQNCTTDSKWNFFSALLFTVTVMSTVGYGYIAPITWEGRIVCICYASIGIPIFLLCLANLSSTLGHLFKLIYAKLKYYLAMCFSKKYKKQLMKNNDQTNYENEMSSNVLSNQLNQLENKLYESDVDLSGFGDNQSCFDQNDEIPVLVVLTVIVIYILSGAFIFSYFESWSLTQSAYFVYVTLSTIGFGDLVPGISAKDSTANLKLFTVCIYSLFGMAIIGMCINVMQDAAKRNVSKLVRHLKNFVSFRRKQEKNLSLDDLDQEQEEMLRKIQTLKQLYAEINTTRKRKSIK